MKHPTRRLLIVTALSRNEISPIHSDIRAGGNSKTGIDDCDRMLFSLTSSMCPSPETV